MNNYVFGYGSLVDIDSVAAYLGRTLHQDDWKLCYLNGYRRCWNVAMDNSIDIPGYKYFVNAETGCREPVYVAFLNIRACQKTAINGVVFRVSEQELSMIDQRERNYDRIKVTDLLDIGIRDPVWSYRGSRDGEARYQRGLTCKNAVVGRDYHDRVVGAFQTLGQEYFHEYERTTDHIEVPIVNLRWINVSQ